MTTIDRTEGFNRHWGLFETLTPLVQSTPGGSREVKVGDAKVNIVTTRTWRIGVNDIPVVSSSSIRAALRRALGYHLLKETGVKRAAVKLSAAHLLLAGGALGTNMENDLTPEKIQEIRHLIPPLALLGGTAVGGFLHGRLMMGNWVAQTTFTPGPALILDQEGLPTRDEVLVTEHFARTAFDPSEYMEDRMSGVGVAKNTKRVATDPIPYGLEAVVPGVKFAGWVGLASYRGLDDDDDLVQRACLRFGLERALRLDKDCVTVLGLRSSAGYGVVKFDWDVSSIADSTEPYLEYLAEHKKHIGDMLQNDDLVPRQKKNDTQADGKPKARGKGKAPVQGAEEPEDLEEELQ